MYLEVVMAVANGLNGTVLSKGKCADPDKVINANTTYGQFVSFFLMAVSPKKSCFPFAQEVCSPTTQSIGSQARNFLINNINASMVCNIYHSFDLVRQSL